MFRVTSFELGFDEVVAIFPETGEVVGGLDGAAAGSEDVDGEGDFASGDVWGVGGVVEVLEDGVDLWRGVVAVFDVEVAAVAEFDGFWGVAVEEVALGGGEPGAEGGVWGAFFELADGGAAEAHLFDDEAAVVRGDGWEFEFGHPGGELVEADDELFVFVGPGGEVDACGEDFISEEGGGEAGFWVAAFFAVEDEVAEASLFAVGDAFVDGVVGDGGGGGDVVWE